MRLWGCKYKRIIIRAYDPTQPTRTCVGLRLRSGVCHDDSTAKSCKISPSAPPIIWRPSEMPSPMSLAWIGLSPLGPESEKQHLGNWLIIEERRCISSFMREFQAINRRVAWGQILCKEANLIGIFAPCVTCFGDGGNYEEEKWGVLFLLLFSLCTASFHPSICLWVKKFVLSSSDVPNSVTDIEVLW